MNLFYKPSISDLATLLEQGATHSSNYFVIIDYDGEVLIADKGSISPVALNKFKFYFTQMSECPQMGYRTDKFLKFLNQLFKSLVFCWESNITGEINFLDIQRIQNKLYQKEAKEIHEHAYPVRLSIGR